MGKTIFALIILIFAGTIFVLYTQPTYAQVGSLQQQIAQYNDALGKATQLQQLREGLMSRYNSFSQTDLNRLQTMLPDHVDNIALILDLDNLASKYGMALENVDVSAPSDSSQSGSGSQPAISNTIGQNNSTYESITLHFSAFGTYADFKTFLQQLESSLRILDLEQLSLSPQSGGITPGYRYDITLRTYWLK